jgi:hypothetical protein
MIAELDFTYVKAATPPGGQGSRRAAADLGR